MDDMECDFSDINISDEQYIDDNGHYKGFRGATIKNPEKLFLDAEKSEPRITVGYEPNNKKHSIILKMKHGEFLADILDFLPYGLIDKKITGIGATTLEIRANRNSIIVLPTRVLAKTKADKENERVGKEICLFVGTKDNNISTSKQEINTYLDNPDIQPKKLLVVADSLKKVIETIEGRKEDAYKEYFLMVDEIDVMQSDSHYRPQLENVIDYYLLKFEKHKRALVSATVRDFTHPKLKDEGTFAFSAIEIKDVPKRSINLIHSTNIHKSVCNRINDILSTNPLYKILVAYNSINGILTIINLLDENIRQFCGILCSEASKDETETYYTTLNNDHVERNITFMTCAYFTGIDIMDNCHLITVSDIDKPYSILPVDRITQIRGRCRNGILSDTIIYNSKKMFDCNIQDYRDELLYKAEKVIGLLKAADEMIGHDEKKGKKLIKNLFDRIKHLIVERADETLLSNAVYRLIRYNVFDKSIIQPAYFNIDALCEKMEAITKLYAQKNGLYKELSKKYDVTIIFEEPEITEEQVSIEKRVEKKRQEQEYEKLKEAKDMIIRLHNMGTLDKEIDFLIRNSKSKTKNYYEVVKKYYQYIDINILCEKLLEIKPHRTAYRTFNNALSFRILEKNHPFRIQIRKTFKRGRIYTSEEIAEELNNIFKYHFHKTTSQDEAVTFFNNIFETERGNTRKNTRKIVGNNPLKLPKPIKTISTHELNLHLFFEIVNSNPQKKILASPL